MAIFKKLLRPEWTIVSDKNYAWHQRQQLNARCYPPLTGGIRAISSDSPMDNSSSA